MLFPPLRFAKFDLLSPAVKRGLPVTQVICRMALQDILLNALGPNIVSNNSKVVDFVQDSQKVTCNIMYMYLGLGLV